jgi:hypothetical protein
MTYLEELEINSKYKMVNYSPPSDTTCPVQHGMELE